ncbi:MAG: exosome complex protein Rrp42 [Candidatus Micrarchaeia archaeon]
MEALDLAKISYVKDLISNSIREDDREMFEYRKISIVRNPLQNAEGSARVQIGNTDVLCGIKFEIGEPFPDKPDEGTLSTNVYLLPLASERFIPFADENDEVEISRVVDRGIRSAYAVDTTKLFIEESIVWNVYIDVYVLNYDGNIIDTASLAAMQAILDTKIPKYEDGEIIRDEFVGKLPSKRVAVSTTFGKINKKIFIDPSLNEELALDSRITISTTNDHLICAIQKGLKGSFSIKEVEFLIDKAFEKGDELRKLLKGD